MFKPTAAALAGLSLLGLVGAQTYSATYLPSNAPNQSEQGQAGTNQCGTGFNQTSECQNAYINSVDDFCVFAPPDPGPNSVIGNTERYEVSWCLKSGYGTRLMPNGTITGAHFVQTPDYVQVTGVGDLTLINIPAGDAGGELDPHGADGNGNPIGGLVFSSAFGTLAELHEWTNFVSANEFCFRACKDGPNAPALCNHIYDVMGCAWNMPGNYSAGVFERCLGDTGPAMGVYGSSTFYQGQPATPPAQPAAPSSSCTFLSTVGNAAVVSGASTSSGASASTTAHSSGASTTKPSGSATSTGSSSSAGSVVFAGWEKVVMSAGVAVVGGMVGAIFVL
ncbi:hypothetical protein JAAARDRAFT_42151 [Jaapia argillacea MUCL 33604]|uniref:Carbohydrate-binding module family 13 protein n=1 Tax=Jaapia argillacea MUCL 33604 TaxID=933084 RepID=A0A067PIS4_9AGAM|nr:hypothetical protein JAAARDRAFT_42151 [Jaapia argillacea MUCL 33604]